MEFFDFSDFALYVMPVTICLWLEKRPFSDKSVKYVFDFYLALLDKSYSKHKDAFSNVV